MMSVAISSRTAIAVLTVLLLLAVVMMPVHIRPAAYNQRDPPPSRGKNNRDSNGNNLDNNADGYLGISDEDNKAGAASPEELTLYKRQQTFILNLYVVFHQELDDSLFEDLHLPDALPDSNGKLARLKTGSIVDVVLAGNGDVTFFATNKNIEKTFNYTNPLFRDRTINEWETRGFKETTGDQYGSAFNEFGAMASIYYSQFTYSHWENPLKMQTIRITDIMDRPRHFILRNGLDDCFIGILQYDMRLNSRVVRMLRKRIERTRKAANLALMQPGKNLRDGPNQMFGGSIRIADQNRAIRMSRMHSNIKKKKTGSGADGSADDVTTPAPNSKCCVFYSVQYPMQYLLKRDAPATQKLLRLYNQHFFKSYNYDDLAKFAILDAFVIPFAEFNKLVPFLENLMRNYVSQGMMHKRDVRKAALRELEQALALYLGLMGRDQGFTYVMLPLRHEPAK